MGSPSVAQNEVKKLRLNASNALEAHDVQLSCLPCTADILTDGKDTVKGHTL